MSDDLPETLYHYTDIHGLQGIWEKGQLWATEHRYLNDTSEAELGLALFRYKFNMERIDLLRKQTDLLKKESKIYRDQGESSSEDEIEAIEKEVSLLEAKIEKWNKIEQLINGVSNYTSTFVVSLSKEPDQLSQWRGYAKDGYCIGFSTEILKSCLPDGYELRSIPYGDEARERHFEAALKKISDVYDAVDGDESSKESLEFTISEIIARESLFVKDVNFQEEKEVRIFVPAWTSPNLFTPGKYGMTPRVTIELPEEAVAEVIVGPGVHRDLRTRSLIHYFHNVRFKREASTARPEVSRSKIPYRDW